MLILPHTLAMVIGACAPLFSPRVFEHVKRLIISAILAPGKRTVTAVLRVSCPRSWVALGAPDAPGAYFLDHACLGVAVSPATVALGAL